MKVQGKDAGLNFLLEKQAMPDIKKELIQHYISAKDFHKAKQLAEEGYHKYFWVFPLYLLF